MGVPRAELPTWDDLQVLTAQLHRFPRLDDEPVDTAVTIGPAAREPLRLRHPGLRVRHELRRAVGGGEDRAGPGRGGRGHGDLLGRGRDAARGAGGVLPLPLRARVRPVRLGRGVPGPGAGAAPQAGPGREDRHRRAPARHQGRRPDRRGPRAARGHGGGLPRPVHRLDDPARRPRARRPGAAALRRDPGRGEDVGPARRGRPRRRAGPRRRLRDPRRPGRRHRRGADDLPRHDQRADDGRARPGPAAPRPGRGPRRHARRHRRVPARPGHGEGAGARRGRDRGVQRGAAGDRLRRACGPATPTTARWASPPRSRTCAPGCPCSGPPSSSPATSARSPS